MSQNCCKYTSNACQAPGKLWLLSGRKLFIILLSVNKPFCGINSTCYSMHQGLCCCCYFWLYLSSSYLGEAATHSLGLYGDILLEVHFPVGQLCLDQITFGPLPHHSKIHHRDYIERIPLNAKTGDSKVCSHCTSPENVVQLGYDMETDTQANQYIPDAWWTGICQQTEILVPPWESALGGLCAMSKCSRLIWTTLGCVTCCTWCDHPRWSCISRITVHRWHWSWSVVVLNSSHGFILLILPYIGVDGKQIVLM